VRAVHFRGLRKFRHQSRSLSSQKLLEGAIDAGARDLPHPCDARHTVTASQGEREYLAQKASGADEEQREHPDAAVELWAMDEHRIIPYRPWRYWLGSLA
jgi:hypothetical protein